MRRTQLLADVFHNRPQGRDPLGLFLYIRKKHPWLHLGCIIKPNMAQSCQILQKQAKCGTLQKPLFKAKKENPFKQRILSITAGGGTRTHTPSRTTDFESVSSANSDTPAHYFAVLFLRLNISIIFVREAFVNNFPRWTDWNLWGGQMTYPEL